MRQAPGTPHAPADGLWPAFGISHAIREKLMRISPATIDHVFRKDKAALALKGKSLTKPAGLLKHRISIRIFHTPEEQKLPTDCAAILI
jgi:hypothetical protein